LRQRQNKLSKIGDDRNKYVSEMPMCSCILFNENNFYSNAAHRETDRQTDSQTLQQTEAKTYWQIYYKFMNE